MEYMKIRITEKFLWDVYAFLEKTGDAADFIFSSSYKKGRILTGGENPIFRKYRHDMGSRRFSKLVHGLKERNYIQAENVKGKVAVSLSKKGISKVLRTGFSSHDRKKRKDGKWIMVIFDVPQNHPKARSLLRSILKNLGYKLFQQSVWVTPYDVSEKTEKLLQMHYLDRYVRIFLTEEL